MFVADDPRLAIPVALPHRVVLVHAVVLGLVALLPSHHAWLMAEVPKDPAEHRRRLHPHDLLVVEDAEVAPDALDVAAALVRVPAVDRGVRAEHFEHIGEHRAEEAVGVLDVDLAVAVGPVLAAVVRPLAGVVNQVGRVGGDQRGLVAAHDAQHVLQIGAVAAEQPVVAEYPEVAGLGNRDGGRILSTVVDEVLVDLLLLAQLLHEGVDVVLGVADAVECVLGLELLQQLGQFGLVPLRELVGAVVGDGEGRRSQVVAVEPPDRHLGHAQALGGLQPGVAGDDLARAAGDDGLLPAEAAQAGRDVGDGVVVAAGVGRAAEEAVDRDRLDGRGSWLVQVELQDGDEPLGVELGRQARLREE